MADTRIRYICFPSVVRAGDWAEITIFPNDISRRFREDTAYWLGVTDLSGDMVHYYDALPPQIDYRVESGCLKFRFFFEKEQEYRVYVGKEGEAKQKLALYAVNDDLYRLRPLKGDLHTHSYYSDGADGVAMTPADYRREGFDFFALTDHNRMHPSAYAQNLFAGVPLGLHMMSGEEIHTPGSLLHIVHVGGAYSVCEKYVKERAQYEAEVDKITEKLTDVPESYRRRVAMACWACEEIHRAGGLAIFPHPFWMPYKYNLSDEFRDLLFDQKIFDAFEIMNGIGTEECNLQLALWQEQVLRGNALPVVGSSDSHNHDADHTTFGRRFTVVFAAENTTEAILEAVRQGYSVAGELPPGDREDVRFYGSLRLVRFAHFLFRTYFRRTYELCAAEGVLMQRYSEGEEVAAPLEALAGSVKRFYREFYGILPAPVVPPERLAWLDSLARAQEASEVHTKGSDLTLYPGRDRRI